MNVLVIDALARFRGHRYSTYDVAGAGPRVVAGLLNSIGIRADMVSYEKAVSDIDGIKKYDIVMVSAMITDIGAVEKLTRLLRKSDPIVIVGGPISLSFNYLLNAFDNIDIVVIGEGEIALTEIFSKYSRELMERDFTPLENVKGLAFKTRKKLVFTGFPQLTPKKVLDEIKPFTRVNQSYELPWYIRFYVEIVRGCSNFHRPLISIDDRRSCIKCMMCYSKNLIQRLHCPKVINPGCAFCSVPSIYGYPRSRSIESIIGEIKDLIRHGARRIVLSAPDFLDYGREALVKDSILTDPCNPPPNINAIRCLFERLFEIDDIAGGEVTVLIENIKSCLVTENVAKLLGMYLKDTPVHIGLETCDDTYNMEKLGKPITLGQTLRAIRILRKYGLRPYLYLIYGLPYANKQVYRKTLEALKTLYENGVEKITLYKFIPLPMSSFENLSPVIHPYNEIISKIKEKVLNLNKEQHKKMIGASIECFIIKAHRGTYGYPVKHGPVVVIKDDISRITNFKCCRAMVRITGAGNRVVYGKIIKINRIYK